MVIATSPSEVGNLYFEWLCLEMDVPEEYLTVMGYLFNREYIWSVPNDDNRAADGVCLRDKFIFERFGPEADLFIKIEGPCTVLEMIVALAKRMEDDIMFDPELGDRSSVWFWTMITNLGLDRYSDDQIDLDSADEINHILDVFLDRQYFMNGTGGLFPLRKPQHNQRRVEVWYQMHAYINENFDF